MSTVLWADTGAVASNRIDWDLERILGAVAPHTAKKIERDHARIVAKGCAEVEPYRKPRFLNSQTL